ncbi:MAG: hypothetical protein PF904_13250 [Kiritimatiellae bacterium]|jgi:neutral ceramidase|nr:hypothetical protein [Kiritimatiellia bacterium]
MFTAGVSSLEISPKPGVQLAGYPHCPRPNRGVHDPLYAVALCLDNGTTRKVIITVDLLSIGKQSVARLRSKFDCDITVTASHTHSGPWASEPLASEKAEGIEQNPDYMEFLDQQLEMVVRDACENRFEAEFASGVGACGAEQGVGGNRRVRNGISDPAVNVMAVRDKGGCVRAVFLNYALHPTYLHADNEFVSADYPAYIRRYLKFAFPDAVFMFAQGASGNQSSRYHRVAQNFEEAARVGATLGVEVFHCINAMPFTDQLDIEVDTFDVADMPMKKFPKLEEALKDESEAIAACEQAKGADYIAMRNAELAMFGAQNTVSFARMADEQYVSPELPLEVQLIRLNDTLIVMVQPELFVEYALKIKKLSGAAKTFVLEVSNGYAPGYLYTPEAGEEGGYEVGTSMFARDAADHLLDRISERVEKFNFNN